MRPILEGAKLLDTQSKYCSPTIQTRSVLPCGYLTESRHCRCRPRCVPRLRTHSAGRCVAALRPLGKGWRHAGLPLLAFPLSPPSSIEPWTSIVLLLPFSHYPVSLPSTATGARFSLRAGRCNRNLRLSLKSATAAQASPIRLPTVDPRPNFVPSRRRTPIVGALTHEGAREWQGSGTCDSWSRPEDTGAKTGAGLVAAQAAARTRRRAVSACSGG